MLQSKQQLILKKFSELENIVVHTSENLEVVGVFTEGLVDRKKILVRLNGKDARLKMTWIFIGTGKNQFDLKAVFEQVSLATVTDITIKAVMFGESKFNFAGNVVIPKTGQKSEASLRCQTLLMSHQAQAKAIPSLEIVANDVKAGHSATTGRVDDELLFYLQTRGFDKVSAEKLLIEGFLREALGHLDQNLQEELWKYIEDSFPK